MNPEQLEIIESFGYGQAVIAGAGCGKTTTLVAKCIALIQKHPQARFCAVSFTEKSVRDLRVSLKKGFQEKEITLEPYRHWIKTIHGLCSSILQEFPIEAGLSGGERIMLQDEMEVLWERSVYLLWTRNENQDISLALSRLLRVYSKESLEGNLKQLRSLISFGVDSWMQKAIQERQEMQDIWKVFLSVFDRFQQWKMKAGSLDFNDLERFALKALSNAQVRQHYHQRFDLVLVDEFQDTNPIQGEILEKLVKPDFSNLCIVGDPKQSIYRFRDADVSVFQDLTARVPKKHVLDTNYRSVASIIDFVNQVCAPVFEASDLSYEPLKSGRVMTEQENAVFKLKMNDEQDLAHYLSEQKRAGVELSDYVILARSVNKEKTQRYLQSLDQYQIPYVLGSGGAFYSDPRVQELVAFLKGWSSPNHGLSQAMALRAPWIGVADQDLLQWKDHFFENFFQHSLHPIALALKQDYLNHSALRPGEILEKIWAALPVGSELELPIASLWQKAESLSQNGRRFEEVVGTFSQAIETKKIEKEVPPPAAQGTVRIMTIHASKGLQFPRVILLDFDAPFSSPNKGSDFIWNRKKGIFLLYRDENLNRDVKHPENKSWQELEKKAAVAESKRLFYVAMTRAQNQLILGWKSLKKESKKEPSYNADDWRSWIELSSPEGIFEVVPTATSTEIYTQSPVSTPVMVPRIKHFKSNSYRPRHSASEWLILNQCELRYQKKFIDFGNDSEIDNESKTEIDFDEPSEFISESSAEKGLRIHSLLEHEDWTGLAKEFGSELAGERVVKELQAELQDDPETQVYRELGFEVPFTDIKTGDEAFVGMMDRLEVNRKEGIIRVIDYKWTLKQKSAEELLKLYQLQLELYAWAAIKMCGPDFKLKKLETKIIHLSKTGITRIPVVVDVSSLEKKVYSLLQKARQSLTLKQEQQLCAPTLGEHCRFCEFQMLCPAQKARG